LKADPANVATADVFARFTLAEEIPETSATEGQFHKITRAVHEHSNAVASSSDVVPRNEQDA
jgi:hypothetical protein